MGLENFTSYKTNQKTTDSIPRPRLHEIKLQFKPTEQTSCSNKFRIFTRVYQLVFSDSITRVFTVLNLKFPSWDHSTTAQCISRSVSLFKQVPTFDANFQNSVPFRVSFRAVLGLKRQVLVKTTRTIGPSGYEVVDGFHLSPGVFRFVALLLGFRTAEISRYKMQN